MKASPHGLLGYSRFSVASPLLNETIALLELAGSNGDERMVVWGAVGLETAVLDCRTIYLPEQTAIRTQAGVGIMIAGEALRGLNLELSRRDEVLAVQLHAHPTEAYHSTTDDALAIATTLGALSVVIPDFASGGLAAIDSWAAYRLAEDGWLEVELGKIMEIR